MDFRRSLWAPGPTKNSFFNRIRLSGALCCALVSLQACSNANVDHTEDDASPRAAAESGLWPHHPSPLAQPDAYEAQIDALLAQMSVEEKVGQMIQPELQHVTPDDVRDYHLGSILNGGGSYPGGAKNAPVEAWLELADGYYLASVDQTNGRTAIPLFWGTDAVHGHNNVMGATLFPHNIGLGAARNPELVRAIAEATAREVSVTGQDWSFAPTLAVARDARWGRTYEAYAEDPELLYAYGKAVVQGLQGTVGDNVFGPGRVLATAKHWIADGGTQGGVDRGDANISEPELRDIHGRGYFGALDAGVQSVMVSFSSWQGEKLHGHKYLMTDVLKEAMGFDGFIIGDWNGHEFVDGCRPDSCPQAVNAGLDIFMVPEHWRELHANTVAKVNSGEIPMARIDDAVRRILRVKFRMGLMDTVRPSERPYAGNTDWLGADEHRQLARRAVRESLVLLKNNNNLLPLDPTKNILVAGDGAHNIGKQSGGWSLTWQGIGTTNDDFPGATSIYQGLAQQITDAGGRVQLSESGDYGLERGEPKPDVAIMVFGEDPYAEMQGDVTHLAYDSESDLALLRRLQAEGIPVVSVFLSGRPMWVNRELNASDAFVAAWLPGTEGGGIADVLLRTAQGEIQYDFTGKLTFSWPASANQSPLNVGDENYTPLFPYGFGLSYSDQGQLRTLSEDPQVELGASVRAQTLFSGRAQAPWRLMVGDHTRPSLDVTGAEASLPGIVIRSVDRDFQEDSRRVSWTGAGHGRVALQSEAPENLTNMSDAALAFNLRIDTPAEGEVNLAMRCGDNCGQHLPLSNQLSQLDPGVWHEVVVSLQCFSQGMDFSQVRVPFELSASAPVVLSVHHVRLEKEAQTTLNCAGN